GSRIKVRCRKCPAKRRARSAKAGKHDVLFRSLKGNYRAGSVLRISVTKPGTIGKYTSIRIFKNRAPRRTDRCLWPGSNKPRKCP
ncbi:MAG TPA: hypothetical protein VNT22_09540, partial [Baekduia sp.]|nr:hypothetical protein [Baekduia sp.]